MKLFISLAVAFTLTFLFGRWTAYMDYKDNLTELQRKYNICEAVLDLYTPELLQFCEEKLEC